MTRRLELVAAVLTVVLAAGCAADAPPPAVATSPPAPSPSPSPTPPPRDPVVGVVETTTTDTSRRARLGLEEDGEPSPGAIDAAATAVAAALDAYLDGAQAGVPDLALLQARWLDTTDPATAAVLRTGLTTVDLPVADATYLLDIHVEPDPTLVVAAVAVRRLDGTDAGLELVFDVTGPRPALLLVGPGGAS